MLSARGVSAIRETAPAIAFGTCTLRRPDILLPELLAEVEHEERCELPIHHQELGREAL